MAIRKKSETIHLRVSPTSKLLLEGLANATKRTATQVIEDLLQEAAEGLAFENEGFIAPAAYDGKRLSVQHAVMLAYVEGQPLLTKIRQWHLCETLISNQDRRVITAIVINREYFKGDTPVFPEGRDLFLGENTLSIERVNLDKIISNWPLLETYLRFRDNNPKLKPDFQAFVKMTESEAQS